MTTPQGLLHLALPAVLLVAIGTTGLLADDKLPADQEQLNAQVLSLLNQGGAIDIALQNAKVAIPDPAKVTKELTDPLVKETLIAVIEKELNDHPGVMPEQVQQKARDQALALLRFFTRKPDAVLSADDLIFANYLASRAFVTTHLARSARANGARTVVPRAGSAVAPTGPAEAADEQAPPVAADASPPPRPSPVAPVTSPAQITPPAGTALPNLINDSNRDQLLARLRKAKDTIVRTIQNNGETADNTIVTARLNSFVRMSPDDSPGTFLEFLGKLTKQDIPSFDALSTADQKEVSGLIDKAVGTATPAQAQEPTKQTTQPDTATQLTEGVITVLGDIFPQFAPFEGLADDAAEVLVPALERWRPLQRCYERRAAGGGLFPGRGVYYIDQP